MIRICPDGVGLHLRARRWRMTMLAIGATVPALKTADTIYKSWWILESPRKMEKCSFSACGQKAHSPESYACHRFWIL